MKYISPRFYVMPRGFYVRFSNVHKFHITYACPECFVQNLQIVKIFPIITTKQKKRSLLLARGGNNANLKAPACGGTQKSVNGNWPDQTIMTTDVSLYRVEEGRKEAGWIPHPAREGMLSAPGVRQRTAFPSEPEFD